MTFISKMVYIILNNLEEIEVSMASSDMIKKLQKNPNVVIL